MKLLIDQGNTRLKFCTWDGKSFHLPEPAETELPQFLAAKSEISEAWVSSVRHQEEHEKLSQLLSQHNIRTKFACTLDSQFGLQNSYPETSQMGVDRWLAMLGIWCEYKRGFILVDAGTALTMDYVDNQGVHRGGHIIPGLTLMQRSLVTMTDRINLHIETAPSDTDWASNTADAVQKGSLAVVVAYIEAMCSKLSQKHSLYLAGGDATIIKQHLDINAIIVNNLVFKGLVKYFSQG